jgi:catechol 2,3-dioxygenase-like lactoylglutathione lyase family enzyme
MKRIWPIIAVADVVKSAAWYMKLLDAKQSHPGGAVFDQIVGGDREVLICLHHWGPSGPKGDHVWPSLYHASDGTAENGLLLWFVVDDFEAAWRRVQTMGAVVEETPNVDNGTRLPAFVVRDPDGYYVAINAANS